jgi:hypothetical protein
MSKKGWGEGEGQREMTRTVGIFKPKCPLGKRW